MKQKIKYFLLLSFIFLIFLILIYWSYISFFEVNVVLFSSLFCVFISLIPITMIIFLTRIFNIFNNFEKIMSILLFFLLGYSFAISIPTVIDRSLSFYILEKIDQRGGGINKKAFENIFKEEYLYEHRLMDIRLTEQLESGTIIIKDDCVMLTNKGKLIIKFSDFFRKNFLPEKRLIMGEYSDDLINPLQSSNKSFLSKYRCL